MLGIFEEIFEDDLELTGVCFVLGVAWGDGVFWGVQEHSGVFR